MMLRMQNLNNRNILTALEHCLLGGYGNLSTELLTDYHHNSIIKLSVRWCLLKVGEGRGKITQDTKIGGCVPQCEVPHQWIARQVGPVSVYCDGGGVFCVMFWHGIPV